MNTQAINFGAIHRIKSLGTTKQADELKHGAQYSDFMRGALVAILRYGHYEAGKLFAKAGVPVFAAYGLVKLAMKNGYSPARR